MFIQTVQLSNSGNTRNPFEGKINQETAKDAPLPFTGNYLDVPEPLSAIVSDLQLESEGYTDPNTGKKWNAVLVKLASVLVEVSQAKKIVKTEIEGRPGTVKEYIGLDDYNIEISGVIVASNGHYPQTEVNTLQKLLDVPASLKVTSKQLNNMGIYELVVETYSFPQELGSYSKQFFTVSAISNMPIILQMT